MNLTQSSNNISSCSSSEDENTTLTLSLNGVNFQLRPDDDISSLSLSHSKADEYSIRLTQFTGELRVIRESANKKRSREEDAVPLVGTNTNSQNSVRSLAMPLSQPVSPDRLLVGRLGALTVPTMTPVPVPLPFSGGAKKKKKMGQGPDTKRLGALAVPVFGEDSDIILPLQKKKKNTDNEPKGSSKKVQRSLSQKKIQSQLGTLTSGQEELSKYIQSSQLKTDIHRPSRMKTKKKAQQTLSQKPRPPPPAKGHSKPAGPNNTENNVPLTSTQNTINSIPSLPPLSLPTPQTPPAPQQNVPHVAPITIEKKEENQQTQTPPSSSSIIIENTPSTSPSHPTNTPSSRWGHTFTQISPHHLLLYGGESSTSSTLSSLYLYNLPNRTWAKPVNCSGIARTWHTSTFLPHRQLLIAFGGESANDGKIEFKDNLMVLDTEIMLWYPPVVSGTVPSGRSGHSAALLQQGSDELVIFGGVKRNKWLNSVAVLDTTRWKWCNRKIMGDAPQPRSYHSLTTVGQLVVVFGGNDELKSFDSVHVLDTGGAKWAWMHPNVSGRGPRARTGHTATLLPDKTTMLIYGGWDPMDEDEEEIFDDAFLLDTKLWSWRMVSLSRKEKRVGHESVVVVEGNNNNGEDGVEVLVFGGRGVGHDFESSFSGGLESLKVDMS